MFEDLLFLHIYKLILDAALFEKTLGFLCVVAFLSSEYLYVHCNVPF